MSHIDLFAGGAAGWGTDGVGIELADHAVATRRARGLPTLQGDVAALKPAAVADAVLRATGRGPAAYPVVSVTASPPCTPFSTAGKMLGRADLEELAAVATSLAEGRDRRREVAIEAQDPRSLLAVEPLRWVLHLRPTWTAWEQVNGVMPLWNVCAQILAAEGYNTWTGLVDANDHGVAQTRKRAILLAHREHAVGKPPPTHAGLVINDVLDLTDEVALRMGRARGTRRLVSQPAPTIMFGKSASGIVFEREDGGERRITLDEAAQLQGLDTGIPWAGGHVAAFRQVGDAIPPPLARALIASVTGGVLIA